MVSISLSMRHRIKDLRLSVVMCITAYSHCEVDVAFILPQAGKNKRQADRQGGNNPRLVIRNHTVCVEVLKTSTKVITRRQKGQQVEVKSSQNNTISIQSQCALKISTV